MSIKWENKPKNLCVVCGKSLKTSSYYICLKCKKICDVIKKNTVGDDDYFLIEIKSACCNADVITEQKISCSEECHLELVKDLECRFGKFKKVVDLETNIPHRVPTVDLIEKGLNQKDLVNYPKW